MIKERQNIIIPITPQLIQRIHAAYRFSLVRSPLARRERDTAFHEQQIALSLAKLALRQYLNQNNIPYTDISGSGIGFEATDISLGNRRIKFLLSFSKTSATKPQFSLIKSQFERLENTEDLIVLAEFTRPKLDPTHSGYYYFLPTFEHYQIEAKAALSIITPHESGPLTVFGLDRTGETINVEIPANTNIPTSTGKDVGQISFLYTTKPNFSVDISFPEQTYYSVQPADWIRFGLFVTKLELYGYLPAIELKRRVNKRLFVDTPYRIRYFKDEKIIIDPADSRDLSKLFKVAKFLDRGK